MGYQNTTTVEQRRSRRLHSSRFTFIRRAVILMRRHVGWVRAWHLPNHLCTWKTANYNWSESKIIWSVFLPSHGKNLWLHYLFWHSDHLKTKEYCLVWPQSLKSPFTSMPVDKNKQTKIIIQEHCEHHEIWSKAVTQLHNGAHHITSFCSEKVCQPLDLLYLCH